MFTYGSAEVIRTFFLPSTGKIVSPMFRVSRVWFLRWWGKLAGRWNRDGRRAGQIADVYAAAGKFWNQLMVLGGIAYVLDVSTLRAEAVLPWDLDDGELDRPRVTLGVEPSNAALFGAGADAPGRSAPALAPGAVLRTELVVRVLAGDGRGER